MRCRKLNKFKHTAVSYTHLDVYKRQAPSLTTDSSTFSTENILQWNINGCTLHYCKLKTLLFSHITMCVCLQAIHFRP